jgi:hypothetical protein
MAMCTWPVLWSTTAVRKSRFPCVKVTGADQVLPESILQVEMVVVKRTSYFKIQKHN